MLNFVIRNINYWLRPYQLCTMPISFHYQQQVSLANRSLLKDFIASIFNKEKKRAGEIQFVFCSDEYLLEINKQSLGHNYYTDIITFDLSMPVAKFVDAEIYISVDRVRENAQTYKTSFKNEIQRVMFHGILHLCGYKDKSLKDISMMRMKEDYYLSLYEKTLK